MIALVHDNSQIPNMDGSGIQLAPGRKHKLSFKKKTNFFLPSPYTTCVENSPLSMKAVSDSYHDIDYAYSQLLCAKLCMQAYM